MNRLHALPDVAPEQVTLLGQDDAIHLDEDLMTSPGFSVDQLMELAGLSVACAVAEAYPTRERVLVVAGPGNNGGDGLVAARHLWQFGYKPSVVYPKRTDKPLYKNLVTTCEWHGIPVLDKLPDEPLSHSYDLIIDAIFGFSFKGVPRAPFDAILARIAAASAAERDASSSTCQGGGGGSGAFAAAEAASAAKPPGAARAAGAHGQHASSEGAVSVVAVDVPSGWDVEEGDVLGTGYSPAVLVSLTAPKRSARLFTGRHYVGGRFVPPHIAEKYGLKLPPYPADKQCVEIRGWSAYAFAVAKTTRQATLAEEAKRLHGGSEARARDRGNAGALASSASSAASSSSGSNVHKASAAAAAAGAAGMKAGGAGVGGEAAAAAGSGVYAARGEGVADAAVVWVSASRGTAMELAKQLVERELAACANVFPVQSVYRWEGKVQTDEESILMIKTRAALLPKLTNVVKELHAYEVPETIAASIVGGNRAYLDWVSESTAKGGEGPE